MSCFAFILDRHHAWRSLDPTVDIWSNFVKEPAFFLFATFKKTHLSVRLFVRSSTQLSTWLSAELSALLSAWLSARLSARLSAWLSARLSGLVIAKNKSYVIVVDLKLLIFLMYCMRFCDYSSPLFRCLSSLWLHLWCSANS